MKKCFGKKTQCSKKLNWKNKSFAKYAKFCKNYTA